MILMSDLMAAEERRKDQLRELEIERLVGKNPSPLQLKLRQLLLRFGEALQTRFMRAKSKSTAEKTGTGQLLPGHR
ncbi:MAG: hypothetical protein GTO14_25215 [Anaerolineales bacterium]|nr:hypothetical protein [Anaerolineales bacterium]